jgi:glc operon protein GlcG
MQATPYGPPIALTEAKAVIEAAESEARGNGWAMVIAVVDSTGHLVALSRMDDAQYGSIAIAQAKARTAVDFKRETKVFEDAVAGGGVGLRVLSAENICAIEGGAPLVRDGRIVGAIGVSGAKAAEDGQVAAAGVHAFGR